MPSLQTAIFSPTPPGQVTTLEDIPSWKVSLQRLLHLRGERAPPAKDAPPPPAREHDSTKTPPPQQPSIGDYFSLVWGDLTKLQVDCIVNAANVHFSAGGGVNGAIHRKAGPALQQECIAKRTRLVEERQQQEENNQNNASREHHDHEDDKQERLVVADCIITSGYGLPSRHVIHVISPGLSTASRLSRCYTNALDLAIASESSSLHDISSIAFCCIGCGSHMMDTEQGAEVAIASCVEWLGNSEERLPRGFRIIFCCYDEKEVIVYRDKMLEKVAHV